MFLLFRFRHAWLSSCLIAFILLILSLLLPFRWHFHKIFSLSGMYYYFLYIFCFHCVFSSLSRWSFICLCWWLYAFRFHYFISFHCDVISLAIDIVAIIINIIGGLFHYYINIAISYDCVIIAIDLRIFITSRHFAIAIFIISLFIFIYIIAALHYYWLHNIIILPLVVITLLSHMLIYIIFSLRLHCFHCHILWWLYWHTAYTLALPHAFSHYFTILLPFHISIAIIRHYFIIYWYYLLLDISLLLFVLHCHFIYISLPRHYATCHFFALISMLISFIMLSRLRYYFISLFYFTLHDTLIAFHIIIH